MGMSLIAHTAVSIGDRTQLSAMLTAVLAWLGATASEAPTREGNGPVARAQSAGAVITVVVLGIVSLIGILIFSQIWEAMAFEEGDVLYSSTVSIMDGFGNAMEFVPIVMLVFLASVVISVVSRMRGAA